ncbi:Acetyltransferase (GNAT) domain-containing protein [Paenibacillus sp. yr247]|uniref:GNAT family N-acetyltransferase n=1 Tax=Paenibacillus sp. yr247 TaxID=1761880 RepID=UPI00088FFCDF|nr:GNAT family N-acetyltransferase [Paenibacillus sp. yr247]SDO10663.1 Acetyltransferase (GNAT) domain-containing protein [Paenibacillus sp. yr247]
MLIDVKSKLRESNIQELLSYSVFPDPDELEQTISLYENDSSMWLYGYESEGVLVGIIGFRINDAQEMTITHLAVGPESRGVGFGRGIILEIIEEMHPVRIVTETDEETVQFYRNIGFVIRSLGEKYPGVERFLCTYEVEGNLEEE